MTQIVSSDEDFEIDLDLTTSTMADNEEGDEAGEEEEKGSAAIPDNELTKRIVDQDIIVIDE